MSLATLTLDAAARKLREREITSVELTEAVLERIQANDARIQAYITVDRDGALELSGQAWQADGRLSATYWSEAVRERKEPSGLFYYWNG